MKCKIYLSDEGYGHLVRQRAVYEQLQNMNPDITATIQTGSHAEVARNMFSNAEHITKFNNIHWARLKNGSPDLKAIKDFFKDYDQRSKVFITAEEPDVSEFDFVISDFVYEAFPLAKKHKIPAFGVAHFTWDWFFSKMYPVPVSYKILNQMQKYAQMADVVYFPPFTPEEILNFYGEKAREVPLIVRQANKTSVEVPKNVFTVLLMDSGASVLSQHINKAVEQISNIDSMHFMIAENYGIEAQNVTKIPKGEFFSDYIPQVDLVVTRGGFNTISECIAYRTPLLLLGETSNPEIENNLLTIKKEHLGSFISLDRFVLHLQESLNSFIDHEFSQIQQRMNDHEYPINGAEIIAEDILTRVRN